jgi:hypothetical protein
VLRALRGFRALRNLGWPGGRLPDDEAEVRDEPVLPGHVAGLGDAAVQREHGGAGERVAAGGHGGEGRRGEPGVLGVVEPDHRDVLRHAQPASQDGAHGTERQRVVQGEHCVDAFARIEQPVHRRRALGPVPPPGPDQKRVPGLDAARGEGVEVALPAEGGPPRSIGRVDADEGDVPPADAHEVVDGRARSGLVRHGDVVDRALEHPFPHEHQGEAAVVPVHVLRAELERLVDDAVDVAAS